MAGLIDYLNWRGDLSMVAFPFNEIDNAILSLATYIDMSVFKHRLSGDSYVGMQEAMTWFKNNGYTSTCLSDIDEGFVSALSHSDRFRHIKLRHYIDIINEECQFSALCYELEDGSIYLAYRGTDDSIVGWEENFRMVFDITESQKMAREYLEDIISRDMNKLYRIGGHSKGGNLALYSSAHCMDSVQDRIIEIYCNDGPGLCPDVLGKDVLHKIRYRLHVIIPEFTLIGMSFLNGIKPTIIKSNAVGVFQHDIQNWELVGTKFLRSTSVNPRARQINNIIAQWVDNKDMESRREFVNAVFKVLRKNGATRLKDLGGIDKIVKIITDIQTSSELDTGQVVKEIADSAIGELRVEFTRKLAKTSKLRKKTKYKDG